MAMLQNKKLTWAIFLAGTLTSSAQPLGFDLADLEDIMLHDILESYTDHVPTTCSGAADTTTVNFSYPGVNEASEWHPPFIPYEADLFQAEMSHTDDSGNNSWTIRIGQGGNVYSHFCPDLHGETMAPQNHENPVNAPWTDEVQQIVSVNNQLNGAAGACGADGTETCPAYFIHGSGTYQSDSPYTDIPFYSQSLGKVCKDDHCIFASWAQHAHVATPFTSPIIAFNMYTNCGNGIIEQTQMIYK